MSMSPPPQGSHSQASLSPAHSQITPDADIPLESLVQHLLASKRSLSSINTVWRANQIVTAARAALEESVILDARTAFLRRGISQQAKILRRIGSGIDHVNKEGQRDFQDVIRSLDAADTRLQKTMDVLRSTIVDTAFRPPNEEPRSLLDFVDEAGVEAMRTALKDSIDQSQEAQAEFLESLEMYDKDIKSIKAAMISSKSTHNLESPFAQVLGSLEGNAAEMAALLDSLVRHFDLCVQAIKHTEGGFAAVKQAASNNQLPEGVTVSGVIQEPGTDSGIFEPINEEDRKQMLAVLASDAAEVEDVVLELHQRLQSMEEQFEQSQEHLSTLTTAYSSTVAAFTLLEQVGSRLPAYIASSQDFLLRWADSKAQIAEQLEDLEGMRVFYEGYMSSYRGLMNEVSRRKSAEDKMKSVLRKAMEQVRKLHDADSRERHAFRREIGDFLPSDLWPGLVADAPRYEITIVDEDNEVESQPEVETGETDGPSAK